MKQRSRRILIGLVVLVAVGVSVLALQRSREAGPLDTTALMPTIPAEAGNDPVAPTTGPATRSGGEEQGEQSPVTAAPSPALDTQRATEADLVVTYSGFDVATGAVLVGAYVAGVLETGGECGLTLTDGASERTTTVEAVPDARTTSCGELTLPEMTPGSWTGEATYTSAGGDQLSRAVSVEVP
ncbi:hypothetical protein [Blastococcus sp. SYSU DS1024]